LLEEEEGKGGREALKEGGEDGEVGKQAGK